MIPVNIKLGQPDEVTNFSLAHKINEILQHLLEAQTNDALGSAELACSDADKDKQLLMHYMAKLDLKELLAALAGHVVVHGSMELAQDIMDLRDTIAE